MFWLRIPVLLGEMSLTSPLKNIQSIQTYTCCSELWSLSRQHFLRLTYLRFAEMLTCRRFILETRLPPLMESLNCVFVNVRVHAAQCVYMCWSLDPASPWARQLRRCHVGDNIDAYSTPKRLQKVNVEGEDRNEDAPVSNTVSWFPTLHLHPVTHLPSSEISDKATSSCGFLCDGVSLKVSPPNSPSTLKKGCTHI